MKRTLATVAIAVTALTGLISAPAAAKRMYCIYPKPSATVQGALGNAGRTCIDLDTIQKFGNFKQVTGLQNFNRGEFQTIMEISCQNRLVRTVQIRQGRKWIAYNAQLTGPINNVSYDADLANTVCLFRR